MMSRYSKVIFLSIFIILMPISTLLAANPEMLSSKDGIKFMTGGVGHDEVLAMRPYAKNFTLNLLFSEGFAGQAVTDVDVNIYDENSKLVFRVKGAKPLLYVNLPDGTYTIAASNNGLKLRHKLTTTAGVNQKVILNWKNEELDLRETSSVNH